MRTAVVSDVGRRRGNNEDAAFAGRRLLAVADGMGGLPAGELASDIVIRALREADETADADLTGALRGRVDVANQAIRAAVATDPMRQGMGTTVTAMLVDGHRAGLLHVGDSRCYQWRDGILRQVTPDHTYVQALVDQGVLTRLQARTHPQKALVTQALQGDPFAPFIGEFDVRPGDRYLLCSDGLSDVVTDEDICAALAGFADLHACADHLVALALAGGGPDNITIVLAEIEVD
ncbi:MAG TPA: protein phosphatase 2C domain-containing protein [Pilimelia sp.]|nr:protein phosphatase 2C domain-containing protein [Pilimelia sp.]